MVERSAEFRAVVKLFGGEGVIEPEVNQLESLCCAMITPLVLNPLLLPYGHAL